MTLSPATPAIDAPPSPVHPVSAGFTVIELLVAMILLLVAGALVTRVLIGSFGATAESTTGRSARQAVLEAADRLSADLRMARAWDREQEFGKKLTLDRMRDALLWEQPTSWPPGPPLQLHDVTRADATGLTIEADVVSVPGSTETECVTWEIQASPGKLELVRTVRTRAGAAGCTTGGGGPVESAVLIEATVDPLATLPTPQFRYSLRYNVVQAGAANLGKTVAPQMECQTVDLPAGTALSYPNPQLDYLAKVELDLSAFVEHSRATAATTLVSSTSLRSRQGFDYLYAVGCAQ